MDYAMVWSIILTKVALLWLKYKVPNKVRLSLNKYNLKKLLCHSYMKKDSKTTKIELNEQTLVAAFTKSNNVVFTNINFDG